VEEPRVAVIVEKQKVIFLLYSGAHFFVLPFSPYLWSNDKDIVWGISVLPLEWHFTWSLVCSWGDHHFCHSFLIVPETPMPLLGQDLLSQRFKFYFPQGMISVAPFFRNKYIPLWSKQEQPSSSSKTKRFLTVSTSKAVSPKV
jgi:hypothetical protein